MDSPTSGSQLEQYEREVKKNYRYNFIVNAIDGASYWFGFSFISPAIILPLYLSHFTSNPLIFSLIPFLSTAGFLIPQLFTANFVERAPRKKVFPVNIGFFLERLPIFLMTLTAALFAKDQPALALALFLVCYIWYTFGAGLIIVGWQDMVAKIIPVENRGRFFGITNFIGNGSGILGALSVPLLMERFVFPQGFVMAFAAASVLFFISWFSLSLTREPPLKIEKPHVSQLDYLRSLPQIVRRDPNFLHYLIFQIIFSVSGMASGFLIVYSSKTWALSDSQASGYIIAMQVGQALSNLLFGFLADRKGHKLVLEISAAISAASFALSFFAPDPLWFYPIFFLRGAFTAASQISGISIVYEFTTPADRPTYIGLANTVPGLAGGFAPLFGGWLAGFSGYPLTFALSAIAGFASLGVLHWMVREPRQAGPRAESGELSTP